jgi:UDP:flavonoid glycosyltransferase YjiC (YdhE family)
MHIVFVPDVPLLPLQPFVAVALKLKEYGHRVRVATHSPFRGFVEQFGLEMFPLGGDPEVLAEFAVQSKGARFYPAHVWYTTACMA